MRKIRQNQVFWIQFYDHNKSYRNNLNQARTVFQVIVHKNKMQDKVDIKVVYLIIKQK